MLTHDKILAAAKRLHDGQGYVRLQDLADEVGFSYEWTRKKVDEIKYKRAWPYKWDIRRRTNPDTKLQRLRHLVRENPNVTSLEALEILGMKYTVRARQNASSFLCKVRKEDNRRRDSCGGSAAAS